MITQDCKIEVNTRLQIGNNILYYHGLGSICSSKVLYKKLKVQLYIILLRTIISYESETRNQGKIKETRLVVSERKILRTTIFFYNYW